MLCQLSYASRRVFLAVPANALHVWKEARNASILDEYIIDDLSLPQPGSGSAKFKLSHYPQPESAARFHSPATRCAYADRKLSFTDSI